MASCSTEKNARPGTISRATLMPIGLVVGVVVVLMSAAWTVATERQKLLGRLEGSDTALSTLGASVAELDEMVARHDDDIRLLKETIRYLEEGMRRIEDKLGTWPVPDPEPEKARAD